MAHALQINQIAQEDGLAASLLRPRKEIPPPPASQQADRRDGDSVPNPAPGAVDPPAGPRDVDMDDLTAKMTSCRAASLSCRAACAGRRLLAPKTWSPTDGDVKYDRLEIRVACMGALSDDLSSRGVFSVSAGPAGCFMFVIRAFHFVNLDIHVAKSWSFARHCCYLVQYRL